MDPQDSDTTTFATRLVYFRFKVMRFDVCSASATFQRLMNVTLVELDPDVCFVYLGDIIVHSFDLDSHLDILEKLLERLVEAQFKLKVSRCRLVQCKVASLGHHVSADGLSTDQEKVAAVAEWSASCCLRDLRSSWAYAHITGNLW